MRWRILILCGLAPALLQAARILVQAEDLEGPWREQTNIAGYLGRGFRTSNANPQVADAPLTGRVELPAAGRYVVYARGYTSPRGARGFRVQVGEVQFAPTHADGRRGWRWLPCGEAEFPAGIVGLLVHDAGTGFESVDAILITNEEDANPMADDARWFSFGEQLPPEADALRHGIQAGVAMASARPFPPGRAAWEAGREATRSALAASLGLDPLPERTPLNARVTGSSEHEHVRIENVVFESRPRFLVTANLTIPKGLTGPAPAIVVVPGHAMKEGKNQGGYRKAQLSLARLGFVVISYDPIGQGERRQPGFDHPLGYTSLMVGQCNEGMIVWDTMRTIDYLCTRPEVDPERIGLTGNSGGGENTFYTMPLEPRVKVGAACCFVCSYAEWIERGGNHCICNHMPGLIRHMEQFEIIGLNAPRPFLVCNASQDPIFPIEGTRQTVERARLLYGHHGVAERVRLVEAPGGHGWSQPLREATCGWFAHWLLGQGDGSPIPEPDLGAEEPWDAPHLLCFKAGAPFPADSETVITLNRERAKALAAARPAPTRDRLWEALGGRPEPTPPAVSPVHAFRLDSGVSVETLVLQTEPGLSVGLTVAQPAGGGRRGTILQITDGERRAVVESELGQGLLAAGWELAVLNPRATGEAAVHENHVASNAVMLGRPLFGQQAWDVVQAGTWLAGRAEAAPGPVILLGRDASGVLALAAAALGAGSGAAAVASPLSYVDTFENALRYPLGFYVPNLLQVADIPSFVGLAAPAPVLLISPVGMGRQALSQAEAAARLAHPAGPGSNAVTLACGDAGPETDAILAWLGRR